MIPLSWYLILAAALFCIGLFGVLSRRNAIAILLGIELMLNAVNINLAAFWRYGDVTNITGQGPRVRRADRAGRGTPSREPFGRRRHDHEGGRVVPLDQSIPCRSDVG